MPDLTFTQVDLRVGDEFWVVRWKLSGTSVTGGTVDVDIADMVTVEGGAVKEKHTYVDGVAMAAALTGPSENA
ncbi:nuclear transport factor 2 family protein [Nocardia fluminea]|uniref:nuclear transport factor 2 family protein n=1 Tax=Nocardia fluminea TaxID=134984 RepID=UPI003427369F